MSKWRAGCIPESKRVQAPFGARVLSVMCCALTDEFGPGTASPSGLVQRGGICRAELYCPTAPRGEGGAVRHQRGGKPPEVADYRSAYYAIWH